jgi:hypothetical protein
MRVKRRVTRTGLPNRASKLRSQQSGVQCPVIGRVLTSEMRASPPVTTLLLVAHPVNDILFVLTLNERTN